MTDALLQKNTWCLINSSVFQLHVHVVSSLFLACYCVCTQEAWYWFALRKLSEFLQKNVLKLHFSLKMPSIINFFSSNSHCNNHNHTITQSHQFNHALTHWTVVSVWFLDHLVFAFSFFVCFFVSLLLYRNLYIENYFTWCLCSQQSLNCEMVSCIVLFCWLLASTSIKWFRSSVARGLSYYFLPLQ